MSVATRRYAVLHHTGVPTPHFDLVFENEPDDERLTTFRCPRWPMQLGDELEELVAHRRVYLEYEGTVSGYRGTVQRVDAGQLEKTSVSNDPPTLALLLHSMTTAQKSEIVFTEVGATTRWVVTMMRDATAT